MCEDTLDNLQPFYEEGLPFDPEVVESLIDKLHDKFVSDLLVNPLSVNNILVKIKNIFSKHKGQPEFFRNYYHDFVHCITRKSDYTNLRQFEPKRANRVHWIRPILENAYDPRIKYYKFEESNGKMRDYFWYEEKEYVVILEQRTKNYWLVTGYCVDDPAKHRKRFQCYYFQ